MQMNFGVPISYITVSITRRVSITVTWLQRLDGSNMAALLSEPNWKKLRKDV